MREKLAKLAHDQWSGWMDYLFSKGEFNEDGTWIMPKWAVERWKRQAETPYSELSESEKESDRNEADKFSKVMYGADMGNISDGYHTFNDLYEHRHMLFINLVLVNLPISFKTRLNDKKEAWSGWFILGMNTEFGQITYHLPDKYWDVAEVREVGYNFDYDGHTEKDTINRLSLFAQSVANSTKPQYLQNKAG